MAYRRRARRSVRRRAPTRRRTVSTRYRRTRTRRRVGTMSRRAQRHPVCNCGVKQMDPGDKFALCQADPFEPKFFGGKIPDSSTIPSISTPVQYNFSLATNSSTQPNWAHAWAFYPSLNQCNVTAPGLTASTWNWSTATFSSAPVYTTFGQQFEAFRPVAHAIRLSCPQAPTSTTGFVHVALATETFYSSGNSTSSQVTQLAGNLSDLSGYTFYKRVTWRL